MDFIELTQKLNDLYSQWNEKILFPYMRSKGIIIGYQIPFYMGISSAYDPAKKTVMIVGQETKYTDLPYDFDLSLDCRQKWSADYFDAQVLGVKNGIKPNSSPFWNFFKRMRGENRNLIWNNIDKMNRCENNKIKSVTRSDELSLNKQFGSENRSLLEREIDIVKPDLILFVTGPRYEDSMCTSFGLPDKSIDKYRPNKSYAYSNISEIVSSKSQALWTYHPAYLIRIHKTDEFFDYVLNHATI